MKDKTPVWYCSTRGYDIWSRIFCVPHKFILYEGTVYELLRNKENNIKIRIEKLERWLKKGKRVRFKKKVYAEKNDFESIVNDLIKELDGKKYFQFGHK